MIRTARSILFLLVLGAIFAGELPSNLKAQNKDSIDVLKVNTDLVIFDAQVVDKKTRRTIGDLSRDDFEVTENGVKQEIS